MKVLGAFVDAILVLLVILIALAMTETATGKMLTVFGSRTMVMVLGLMLAVGVAVSRYQSKAKLAPVVTPKKTTAHSQLTPAAVSVPDRSPPPIAAPQAIAAASRQAIVFRQDFPPSEGRRGLSFFGGAPITQAPLPWPTTPAGKPLHFLMQIDCAAIPVEAGLKLLPTSGILYVFLDFEWKAQAGCRVMHCPLVEGGWTQAKAPANLGPVYGDQARYLWPWALSAADAPALLPKWPFKPVSIAVGPEAYADREEDNWPYIWPSGPAIDAALVAAQGAEVTVAGWNAADLTSEDGGLRRPFDGFPQDWRALRICSVAVENLGGRYERHPPAWLFPDLTEEGRLAQIRRIRADAQAWHGQATGHRPFDEPPREVQDAFWTWLSDHKLLVQMVIAQAVTHATEASLPGPAAAAARIPEAAAARIHSRHALAVRTVTGFHVNIPDRMLAAPSDVQGNQWERAQTHLLLLEISSNEGLGHYFGEGVHQLWITPDDLGAGHFDRVVMTSDAY